MGSHINDPVTDAQRRVAEDVRKCLKRSPPRDFLYPAEEARQKKYTVSSWGLSKLINTSHRRKEKKKGGGESSTRTYGGTWISLVTDRRGLDNSKGLREGMEDMLSLKGLESRG